jgi:hypothetical protein
MSSVPTEPQTDPNPDLTVEDTASPESIIQTTGLLVTIPVIYHLGTP